MVGEHQTETESLARQAWSSQRLEHALQNIGRDCRTAVADDDAAAGGLPSSRLARIRIDFRLGALHGVQRIRHDVAQQLLEPRLIGDDAESRVNVRSPRSTPPSLTRPASILSDSATACSTETASSGLLCTCVAKIRS